MEANLQEVEKNKIRCGKLHFAAVSDQIKFDWVNSYQDFVGKFGVKDSVEVFVEGQNTNNGLAGVIGYVNKLNE